MKHKAYCLLLDPEEPEAYCTCGTSGPKEVLVVGEDVPTQEGRSDIAEYYAEKYCLSQTELNLFLLGFNEHLVRIAELEADANQHKLAMDAASLTIQELEAQLAKHGESK